MLCVNNGLGMGKGKVGAQCAHAAVGIVGKYFRSREVALRQWEMCGQARRRGAAPRLCSRPATPCLALAAALVAARCGSCGSGWLCAAPRSHTAAYWPPLTRPPPASHTLPHPPPAQPKIALKVQDEGEMAELAAAAAAIDLPTYIVHDAGRTQIPAGSQTVLAIGPGPKSEVDKVTGHLKLLS